MKEFEAQKFYNKQFNLFKNEIDLSEPYSPHLEEIIEQVDKPFETVLELGAGIRTQIRSIYSVWAQELIKC